MSEIVNPEMISINEASSRTGLSYECIRSLCIKGKIAHIKSGVKYLINYGKLCQYLNNEGGKE